ncbi:MAG TPA: YbaB/EbfC family nucleoid-associated protein [Acidimicrobiia bacterium]|nr:YbaB/EbfC family nucleoid-associated protein [Acidimicrobiia bacterium]
MNRQPNMQQLMKQAQQMQEQLMAAQAELAEMTFEGSAGGGVVKAVVKGSNELVSVQIAPDVIDPSDPEMLGDLVVAAVNGAMRAAAEAAESQMGGLAGGLGGLGGLLG